MEDKSSTTPGDNPTNSDAGADSITTTDPQPGTDNQPANNGDNLDPSKSTDPKAADGDTKPADDKSGKTDDKGAEDNPASQLDTDLDEWITKRGFKAPETDAEKQAYQDLRNEQRDFTRSRQAGADAAELDKEVSAAKTDNTPAASDEDDEPTEEQKRLDLIEANQERERTTRLQSEFYVTNKVTNDEHKQIMDVIKEKIAARPTVEGKRAAIDLWGNPDSLPDLLDIARARLAKATDSSAVADEAAQKERERIAKESNSRSPGRSAVAPPVDQSAADERTKALLERYKTPKK